MTFCNHCGHENLTYIFQRVALPETNIAPEIHVWKATFCLEGLSSGVMLVVGSVRFCHTKKQEDLKILKLPPRSMDDC